MALRERADRAQVVSGEDAAGGVVRRVEENRPGTWFEQKICDRIQIRPEMILLPQSAVNGLSAAPRDVGVVGGELRAENQDGIVGLKKCFAKILFENLGSRSDNDLLCRNLNAELKTIVSRDRFS